MTPSKEAPGIRQRLAAVAAILLVAAVVVTTVVVVIADPLRVIAQIVLLAAVALAAWYGLTRVGLRRAVATLIALAALSGSVLVGFAREGGGPVRLVVRIVMLLLAVALCRYAIALNVGALKQAQTPGTPAPPAGHAVLIMNLKSGDGRRSVSICRRSAAREGSSPSCSVRTTTSSSSRAAPSIGART